MRAVLQRVTRARVLVDGNVTGEIGPGLAVLVAVGRNDTAATAASMAEKIVNLRIFGDEQGKMNRSLLEYGWRGARRFAIYAVRRRARPTPAQLHSRCAARARQGAL